MTWYSSWIPGLPSFNFAIPSSIQSRFITFALKKTLGHFLKPGQLDYHQIDSQIGSGYVQVSDLVLNSEAINLYLKDLPISLFDGTLSLVKARVPWPNPLASTLGFSLTSLHLVFHLDSFDSAIPHTDADLSNSIASVAESFLHDELTQTEEGELWRSFHQDANAAWLADEDKEGSEHLNMPGAVQDRQNTPDLNPAGISLFTTLIERLLARFEFDAEDVKVTLVHPGNMGLTLSLRKIQYHTDTLRESSAQMPSRGETRTLSFEGVQITVQDLRAIQNSHHVPTTNYLSRTDSPNPIASPASSNSSIDEETRFAMSQSLAFLPEQPPSPSSSIYSSMYRSAISTQGTTDATPETAGHSSPTTRSQTTDLGHESGSDSDIFCHSDQSKDFEILLSCASQPIVLQLTTPTPAVPSDDPFISSENPVSDGDALRITASLGVIACALQPWHLLGLSRLASCRIPSPTPKSEAQSETPASSPSIKGSMDIRGIVLLLYPSSSLGDPASDLLNFFERPLVPPSSAHGYTRVYLDALSATVRHSTERQDEEDAKARSSSLQSRTSYEFMVVDISIFFFDSTHLGNDSKSSAMVAFPLLITDPQLPSQYEKQHFHPGRTESYPQLPKFEIIDWTEENCYDFGIKLSRWRTRLDKQHTVQHGGPVSQYPPAVCLLGHQTILLGLRNPKVFATMSKVEVQLAPLHIRVDLGRLLHGSFAAFVEGLASMQSPLYSQDASSDVTINETQEWTTTGDTRSPQDENSFAQPDPVPNQRVFPTGSSEVELRFPLVRLSSRCPPPSNFARRSGELVLDFHDFSIFYGGSSSKPSARFSVSPPLFPSDFDLTAEAVLLRMEFRRVVVACSLMGESTANTFASLGPLQDEGVINHSGSRQSTPGPPPLRPRLLVIKPDDPHSNAGSVTALSCDIPSAHIDLRKAEFDSLQYWVDDVAQFFEQESRKSDQLGVGTSSRDTSLIGSRFFARSRNGSGSFTASSTYSVAETVVKLTITEAFIRVMVPRTNSNWPETRPLDIVTSDLDVLLEINPERKQQTVVTVGVTDLTVTNHTNSGGAEIFISLTSPCSLSMIPKPMIKLRLSTSTVPETISKETRIKLTLYGFTYNLFPDMLWVSDLTKFMKNPPGTFESVIPSERTRISAKILDGSLRIYAPKHPGALVLHSQELEFSTDVVGDSRDSSFYISASELSSLALDDASTHTSFSTVDTRGVALWRVLGYAPFIEIPELKTSVVNRFNGHLAWMVTIDHIVLRLHFCADTLACVSSFLQDVLSLFSSPDVEPIVSNTPAIISQEKEGSALMSSVEDLAFKRLPEIGPAPDMIYDDLPTNLDYLDESFGTAGGLRELRDEDLDEFDDQEMEPDITGAGDINTISKIGGETIKMFDPKGIELVEDYFLTLPPDASQGSSGFGEAVFSLQIVDGDFRLLLYDGYDWVKTRKAIEEEVKEMRKRLAKIRQLVANGQLQDPTIEDTSALLFNSVHIGLEQDEDILGDPGTLIAAIDDELGDDYETGSQSSWQSLKPSTASRPRMKPAKVHGKKLTRARSPSMEFCLSGLRAEYDQFQPENSLVSRTFVAVKDLEILDHIKTSTWKKFLTELRSDSRGNVRETDSNMVRIELLGVRPVPGNASEEARLRAKILPLRLYVDQDAVDFLKKFFSFKDPHASVNTDAPPDGDEAYIQLAEIFPVDLKLDYKPRRVDYRALKEGRTIELMNFFHFDGAEMTLRHITLAGVSGWPRLFEMLNDLWTPDVKATQLVEVISGVAPIRSVVNVGSGVADLILLPISQYKKDGRIVRGVQKGATAFVKSTAIEAIRIGAKLATGTQVILEQAEGVLGGQFEAAITTETLHTVTTDELDTEDGESADLISKYAQQPSDLKEGVQSAYRSLQKNLSSAAQTILAVPMEVYERSGNEGPVRAVIRAVPIAVLKPMIGASEAVSKTLLGLHNTLDPNVRHENEAKYK